MSMHVYVYIMRKERLQRIALMNACRAAPLTPDPRGFDARRVPRPPACSPHPCPGPYCSRTLPDSFVMFNQDHYLFTILKHSMTYIHKYITVSIQNDVFIGACITSCFTFLSQEMILIGTPTNDPQNHQPHLHTFNINKETKDGRRICVLCLCKN